MCDFKKIDLGFTEDKYEAGTHMCLIYSDEEERDKIITQFLKVGLNIKEKVDYFTVNKSIEEVTNWLAANGIDIENNENQLDISTTKETYYPNNKFIPEETLEKLKLAYTNAKSNGFENVRISGEMEWALKDIPGSEKLMEYEAKVNDVFKEYPITAICQYNANKFDGKTIFECLKVHPFMIVHGQIIKNPYYLDTNEYFDKLKP